MNFISKYRKAINGYKKNLKIRGSNEKTKAVYFESDEPLIYERYNKFNSYYNFNKILDNHHIPGVISTSTDKSAK